MKRTDYQVEHVLEWQVVTKFFEWVQAKKGNEKFDNPDPTKSNRVAFCPYWKATWEGAHSPVFKLNPDDKKELNAIDHLRYAYPGKGNYEEEFVWLHTAVYSPAKAQVILLRLIHIIEQYTNNELGHRCGQLRELIQSTATKPQKRSVARASPTRFPQE